MVLVISTNSSFVASCDFSTFPYPFPIIFCSNLSTCDLTSDFSVQYFIYYMDYLNLKMNKIFHLAQSLNLSLFVHQLLLHDDED